MHAIGIRAPLVVDDVLFAVGKATRVGPVQVVRADRVLGHDHLAAAAHAAQRAIDEGRAVAERPELEFLRYLAGKRAIRAALDHCGIRDGDETAVVVGLGDKAKDAAQYLVHQLGANVDDSVIDWTPAKQEAWGFPVSLADAGGRPEDLVLESVARVDLL